MVRSIGSALQYNQNPTKMRKILIADDVDVNRKILQRIFKKIDRTEIHCVNNGEDAVEYTLNQKFDLILMDIQMPRLDGIQASRIIRESSINNKTPIIAITALGLPELKEKCFAAGINDYYLIPVIIHDLKSVLNKYLK